MVFDDIRQQLTVVEKNMEETIRGICSLVRSWPANEKASEFWNSYIHNENDVRLVHSGSSVDDSEVHFT